MPYPRELINPHEDLILELHPHWWFLASAVTALLGAVLFGVVTMALGWPSFLQIFAAVVILVALGYFGVRYARWATTYFVLTTDRVIYRSGVLSKTGIEIPLERINTVFFKQRIFERMLGLGDIAIESASKDGGQVFDDIRKPGAVQNEIYRQMESNENRKFDRVGQSLQGAQAAAPAAPAAPQHSIPEQIEHLSRLRDQGILSEAEFQQKKADLLGRM